MNTVVQFPEGASSDPLADVVTAEVRALMARHRVNQTQLAAWLGINQSKVSSRLRGATRWTLDDIERVAEGFAVHPAVLMGGYAEGPRRSAADLPIRQFVRHQGLEPRTRWLRVSDDGVVVELVPQEPALRLVEGEL